MPPLVTAAFSILPHLLAAQILIQNALLAQYYTALHNYCEETGYPSPSPPTEEVIAVWSNDFRPARQEIERIPIIARGKAIHQPMSLSDEPRKTFAVTASSVRNGLTNRRPSTQSQSVSPHAEKRVARISSSQSIPAVAPPIPAPEPTPSPEPAPAYSPPDYSSHLAPVSSYKAHSPAGPHSDHFQRSSSADSIQKKKKPPPPPPKRIGSHNQGTFAIALYSFEGQSQGDLTFKEGDQIKVLKRTDSTDDWWEGELRGIKGSFPANYCKLT